MTKPTKWHVCPAKTQIWASAQSDQSRGCLHEESLSPYLPIEHTAKTQIRLGRCPVWSESLLGAHATLLVFSCANSYAIHDTVPTEQEMQRPDWMSRLTRAFLYSFYIEGWAQDYSNSNIFLKPLFRGNLDPFVNNANLGAIAHTSNGT